jgi:hypothetical protein
MSGFSIPGSYIIFLGFDLMFSISYGLILFDKFHKAKKIIYELASLTLFSNALIIICGLIFDITLIYYFEIAFVLIIILYFLFIRKNLKNKFTK